MTGFADRLGDFSSERLQLRILDVDDAPKLQALTNDRSITDIISFLKYPYTLADAKSLIEQFTGHQDRAYGVWLKEGSTLVALVGAHIQEGDRVEIGYWVGVDFQGRGYGFEAASALVEELIKTGPDHEIFAECLPDNFPSQKLLEKLGFMETQMEGARAGRKMFTYVNRV